LIIIAIPISGRDPASARHAGSGDRWTVGCHPAREEGEKEREREREALSAAMLFLTPLAFSTARSSFDARDSPRVRQLLPNHSLACTLSANELANRVGWMKEARPAAWPIREIGSRPRFPPRLRITGGIPRRISRQSLECHGTRADSVIERNASVREETSSANENSSYAVHCFRVSRSSRIKNLINETADRESREDSPPRASASQASPSFSRNKGGRRKRA